MDGTPKVVLLSTVELILGLIALTTHAVVAGIGPFVEVSGLLDTADDFLDTLMMPVLGGSDEIIVADSQAVPCGDKFLRDIVHPLLWTHTCSFGTLKNFLAVFVHPDDEMDAFALPTVISGGYISADLLDGVTEVGRAIRIVDGGGDVELLIRSHVSSALCLSSFFRPLPKESGCHRLWLPHPEARRE